MKFVFVNTSESSTGFELSELIRDHALSYISLVSALKISKGSLKVERGDYLSGFTMPCINRDALVARSWAVSNQPRQPVPSQTTRHTYP